MCTKKFFLIEIGKNRIKVGATSDIFQLAVADEPVSSPTMALKRGCKNV